MGLNSDEIIKSFSSKNLIDLMLIRSVEEFARENNYPQYIIGDTRLESEYYIVRQGEGIYAVNVGDKKEKIVFKVLPSRQCGRNSTYYVPTLMDTIIDLSKEKVVDEYRKFIEEYRFKRIKPTTDFRPLSVSGLECTKSNTDTIRHATRRSFNDMGKQRRFIPKKEI